MTLVPAANDIAPPLAKVVTLAHWLVEHQPMRVASARANHVYALAGLDPADPPGPGEIVLRLFGSGCARACYARPDDLDVKLFREGNRWTVLVPANLTGSSLGFALARVLARWYAICHAPADGPRRLLIDDVAAAIALPDAAIPVALASLGDAVSIARWLALPINVVAGRLASAEEA